MLSHMCKQMLSCGEKGKGKEVDPYPISQNIAFFYQPMVNARSAHFTRLSSDTGVNAVEMYALKG